MPSHNLNYELNPEHLMRDVYSYPFPEVRAHLGGLSLSPDIMLNTIDGAAAGELLRPYRFEPPLELPLRADNSLDLDEIHLPVIERIRNVQQEILPGLDGFEHAYPGHGSSQAMFNLIAEWRAQGRLTTLAVVEGEYEGYSAYADSLRIPVERHASLTEAGAPQAGRVWFVSNPSATDGNWLDGRQFNDFITAGHDTVVDTAYAGLTDEGQLDVSAPNIQAVLTSPSKIYGVFRYRNTGVTYSREPVASLYGSKWFKDVPALLDTLSLYETFGARGLARTYRPKQEFLCRRLSELVATAIEPSDVLLLGHTRQPLDSGFDKFRRNDMYRFGLTKLFEDLEAAGIEPEPGDGPSMPYTTNHV